MDMVAVMSGEWQRQGVCLDEDPELFFPVGEGPAVAEQISEARIVCAGCPVRAECLTWALTFDEQGVWAGTTDNERRTMQGRRPRRGAGVAA